MKLRIFAAASVAALGALALSSAANAAVTVYDAVQDDLFGDGYGVPSKSLAAHGLTMIEDFDAIQTGVTYTGLTPIVPLGGLNSAPPPYFPDPSQRDPTRYASVQGSQVGTLNVNAGFALTKFSFYLGSPDTYNTVTFYDKDGNVVGAPLSGAAIWSGMDLGAANGAQDWGYRVYYDFGGAKVTKITFASGSDAFEFDGLGGSLVAVPEPSSWALMLLGFGGLGAVLRNRRRQGAVAA